MGWERKRGKLEEFNHLLRGATDTTFSVIPENLAVLQSVRYVITLDSDTQLPLDSASPDGRHARASLEHAALRPASGRVTEGYGVLQPRVAVDLVSANRSLFARIFAGHVGLDPYTTAVSDVYQDLFHEGSFVGKGIYHVDAFSAALAGPGAREHTPQPRPLRRLLRARGALHRHPTRGRLPLPLPGVRRAATPLGAGRLADRAVDLAHGARRVRSHRPEYAAGDRAVEDLRQPAAQPAGAVADGAASPRDGRSCRATRASGRASALLGALLPGALAGRPFVLHARARRAAADAPGGRTGRPDHERQPVPPVDGVAGASELDHDRRHRTHRSGGCSSRAGTCSSGSPPIGSRA